MIRRSSFPRILYVTPLWPPCGAQQRSLNVLRSLQEIGSVEMVLLDKGGVDRDLIGQAGSTVNAEYICQQVARLNEGLIEKVGRKLNAESHYPDGWRVPDEAMGHLTNRLNQFDMIWFFELRSADMFPNTTWPRSVVDIDDMPSLYESSTLQVEGGLRHRCLAFVRGLTWRRREKLLAERFTVLTVCSEEDRQYLRRMGLKAPIHVIPNGFEKPRGEPVPAPARPPRIGFIGHFSHFPNHEGISWFVKRCWPLIKREVVDARLRLVGPGSDGMLKPSGADIEGLGWLANPSDEIKTWSLMVVPIRSGGGTRVKIAQGFSQKCPIVSTSFGAQGYLTCDGHEMYIADSAETFAQACVSAIREPAKAAQMAEKAWSLFLEKWSWDAICPLVWAAAEDCLRLNGRSAASIHRTPGALTVGMPNS
jgi:glycosyltransferase involved in cell wall biosynthesis